MKYAISIQAVKRAGFICPATIQHEVAAINAKGPKRLQKKAKKLIDELFPEREYMLQKAVVAKAVGYPFGELPWLLPITS